MVSTLDRVIEKTNVFTNDYSCTDMVACMQFPNIDIIKVNHSIEIFAIKSYPFIFKLRNFYIRTKERQIIDLKTGEKNDF